jgi:hypothetical protein
MNTPAPAQTTVKKRVPAKRHIAWYKIAVVLWGLLWLSWATLVSYQDSRLVKIPDNISPEVSLPAVNEKALAEIRSRDATGLIVPTQNNSPRANPFQ